MKSSSRLISPLLGISKNYCGTRCIPQKYGTRLVSRFSLLDLNAVSVSSNDCLARVLVSHEEFDTLIEEDYMRSSGLL